MPNYLVVVSDSMKYAIPVRSVEGIYWLPELSPIEAAPPWFVGLVNLHGEVVHVLDLGLRFKHGPRMYSDQTNIVLVRTPKMRCGIIADHVQGLIDVPPESIVQRDLISPPDFSLEYSSLISGEIKLDGEVLLILNLEELLTVKMGQDAEHHQQVHSDPGKAINDMDHEAIFKSRMHQLALPMDNLRQDGLEAYAIVLIGEIQYAIGAQYIAEFGHINQCVSLPCCPAYILGVVNLRGEIICVIDMRSVLNIKNIADHQDMVVLHSESKKIVLAVQKILDFRYVDRHLIMDIQDAEEQHAQCKSLLKLDDGIAGILDVEAILLGNSLEINEHV